VNVACNERNELIKTYSFKLFVILLNCLDYARPVNVSIQ